MEPKADDPLHAEICAQSLDLKGGQAVDRVGKLLGLPFPAGPALEALAEKSSRTFSVRPSMKGADCSLSGIENRCQRLVQQGTPPEDVARFCLDSLFAALDAMAKALLRQYPGLPLVFAGGVMSNRYLREKLQARYQASFAEPAFSSDNAAGVAVLAALQEGML